MGNYNIFERLENPRRGRQARNFTTNVPKIIVLKSSSEQIFSKNRRWVPLSIAEVAQEFVSRNENLKRNFSIADNFKK